MDARGMERGIMGDNKNCFEKRWFIKNDNLINVEEDNLKFNGFERELISDVSVAEYISFDTDIAASEPRHERKHRKIRMILMKKSMISKKKSSVCRISNAW